MNLLVLRQKIQLFPKLGHLSGEDGKDVVFLNGMVCAQVVAKVETHGEELTEGDVRRASPTGAGGVERFPCLAETVVLRTLSVLHVALGSLIQLYTHKQLHVIRHAIVGPEVCQR